MDQSLIKDLAKLAEGDWGYIDVNDASAAGAVRRRVRRPGRGRVPQRRDALRVKKDVKVKRVRMVVPEIKEADAGRAGGAASGRQLGTLERDKPTRYTST